jgi:predicted RNA-binding protein (virulence factor B family)
MMGRAEIAQKGDIMVAIGRFNHLKIESIKGKDYILDGGNRKLSLPGYEVAIPKKVGQYVDVFVYNDQKESLKATCAKPYAQVGEFAVLTVKHTTSFGAFLDWGIAKDLFVPKKHQKREYVEGDYALVYLMLDHEQTGVLGTTYCEDHISYSPDELSFGDKVEMLIIGESKLGFNVIVNNAYRGIVYRSDIVKPLDRGERITGYVKNKREDGRLDCSLKPLGFIPAVRENQQIILDALKKAKGELFVHDKSSPEQVRDMLHMSKKQFKAAAGTLLKEGKIEILPDRIKLK